MYIFPKRADNLQLKLPIQQTHFLHGSHINNLDCQNTRLSTNFPFAKSILSECGLASLEGTCNDLGLVSYKNQQNSCEILLTLSSSMILQKRQASAYWWLRFWGKAIEEECFTSNAREF